MDRLYSNSLQWWNKSSLQSSSKNLHFHLQLHHHHFHCTFWSLETLSELPIKPCLQHFRLPACSAKLFPIPPIKQFQRFLHIFSDRAITSSPVSWYQSLVLAFQHYDKITKIINLYRKKTYFGSQV